VTETDSEQERQRMLQFLTTEHFVLQTARAATIQEANWRASLFLTSVSSAMLALAFIAQVTRMGAPFMLFCLIVLPCLYFIGLVSFVRALQVAIEDMVHARGMARIRHYFIETAPAMRAYLVHRSRIFISTTATLRCTVCSSTYLGVARNSRTHELHKLWACQNSGCEDAITDAAERCAPST
jgi:hypothetical protein